MTSPKRLTDQPLPAPEPCIEHRFGRFVFREFPMVVARARRDRREGL